MADWTPPGGTTGQFLSKIDNTDWNTKWVLPPAYEFDYKAYTAPVSITHTTDATADTIVTANAVTYDGSTIILLEFYAPYITTAAAAAANLIVQFNEGGTILGYVWSTKDVAATTGQNTGVFARLRLTPSAAAHTYSVRAWAAAGSTGTIGAGAGGSDYVAGYVRQTKA